MDTSDLNRSLGNAVQALDGSSIFLNTSADITISNPILFQIQEPTDFFCPEYDFEKLLADYNNVNNVGPTAFLPQSSALDSPTSSSSRESGLENSDLTSLQTMTPFAPFFPRDINDLGDGYFDDSFVDSSKKIVDATIPVGFTTQFGGYYIGNGKLHIRPLQPNEQRTHGGTLYEQPSVETCMAMCKSVPTERKKRLSNGLDNRNGNLPHKGKKEHKRKRPEVDEQEVMAAVIAKSIEMDVDLLDDDAVDVTANLPGDAGNYECAVLHDQQSNLDQPESESSDEKSDKSKSVDLPDGLPQQMTSNIQAFTDLAKKWSSSKAKFTSLASNPEGMNLLLRIEYDAFKFGVNKKAKVYHYLASFCVISKKTLVHRARKLRVDDANKRSEALLQKLLKVLGDGARPIEKREEELIRKLSRDALQAKLQGLELNRKLDREACLEYWFLSDTWKTIKSHPRFANYGLGKTIMEGLSAEAQGSGVSSGM